jgi:signal transduction histidine kinase/CHASE3 domain sensor protein
MDHQLKDRIAAYRRFDASPESVTQRRAIVGFVAAVILTCFVSLAFWYSTRLSAAEADMVIHSNTVMNSLSENAKDIIDTETGARGYALTGQEPFLEPCNAAQKKLPEEMAALQQLVQDNARQRVRASRLKLQADSAVAAAMQMIRKRRESGTAPDLQMVREGKKRMDAVRATIAEMQNEESQLLAERSLKSNRSRRWTGIIAVLGTFAGLGALLLAWLSLRRQIELGGLERAQTSRSNVELDQRITERTTELEAANRSLESQAEELSRQAEDLMFTKDSLSEQSRTFELVLNSIGEGLVAADENGKFVLWNPAAEKILGRGPTAIPTAEWSSYYEVYLPDGVTPFPPTKLPLARALRGEECDVEMVVHNPQSGKALWIEATAHPMRDTSGIAKGGVLVMRDATQKKNDEIEIRRLNEDLEQRVVQRTAELQAANKEMEAFTYSVSHDLRAPLRHISGFTRILVEEYGTSLPAEAHQHLQRIEQGTVRMGRLVDELLSLTRVGRQPLALQVTGLDSIVREVVVMLAPEIEDREVEWKIAPLPFVECDPTLIRQVFQNLISNALKYSRPRAHAVIEIGQMEKAGQPVIFVRDNGVGFSMKYADKLFGVFQRLHRAEDFEGTGVGLATAHRIIQKHGGQIWAEAELDRGATFYFTLSRTSHIEEKNAAAVAGGQI